ncbi:uncharacterized protein LY89DRAFT_253623 [Mollisia scopiformis]|uniref:Zn(2)-C6 fungal-type domain-containing protein n=1 Tax=Mollisia scopiformis TaxID=149040 RepID=A0A132BCX5_MOLSC|nr:uncharacterized protein LY89DRAFT_253623 [Mollisia scopiformis]KUJ10221.1 hypothetical protein LY89DRAFT_253623 [Mollisia scopiformis]
MRGIERRWSDFSLANEFVPHNTQLPRCTSGKGNRSRSGCSTCKKRHIECDGGKPFCMNCQKRGIGCEGLFTIDSQPRAILPSTSLEGTPTTGPLSYGPDPMTVPRILESTQSELSHAFLTTGSEPRERLPALSKPLSTPNQKIPTSYEGTDSEIHSQARVEEWASHSPAT